MEFDREIDEINQRLSDIRAFQSGGKSAGSNNGRSDAPQLDGDALNAVVNLAEQAALSNYLQTSLDQRYALTKERAALSTRLDRITKSSHVGQMDQEFFRFAQTRYENIVGNYAEIFLEAKRVLATQNPSYYSIITQPDTEGTLVSKRDLLFLTLAMLLGGMLAIISALVWPQVTSTS